jgi:hypothetical protein
LLDGVEIALVVHVGEPETPQGDGGILEPVEEVAVLGGPTLEGHVEEREAAGVLFGRSEPPSKYWTFATSTGVYAT